MAVLVTPKRRASAARPTISMEFNMSNSARIERWKPVVGYEGLYEVSDRGRVRSLDRVVPALNGPARTPAMRHFKGRILAQCTARGGYPAVCLTKRGVGKTKIASRLVLEAFVGPCPSGMECCHSNSDPTDSRLLNLRWDTQLANVVDRVIQGSSTAKLSPKDIAEVRALKGALSGPACARRYCVWPGAIYRIWNNTRKTFRDGE